MSKFKVEFTIEAEDLSEAGRIAHENVYFAELEPDQVTIRPVRDAEQLRTFNEPALKVPTVRDVENLGSPYGE